MGEIMELDSITDAGPAAAGRVVASGSHGGVYPAALASAAGVRAVAFNDAGIGLEQAGVAGVLALAGVGMAAVGVAAGSCHIGSARDLVARGRVSVANGMAERLGIAPGMPAAEALALMAAAPEPSGQLPKVAEARREVPLANAIAVLADSASLVGSGDAGRIVITGSHGALIGGDPARALKAPARVAVFNDAGRGLDDIGLTRLPALAARGVAAVTVSAVTARIGNAASALETGVISAANAPAVAMGAAEGMRLAVWLDTLSDT